MSGQTAEKVAATVAARPSLPTTSRAVLPSLVHDVLSAPGEPLLPEVQAGYERRFDTDFSHVRVHTGGRAAESARVLGALAYTWGHHVVLGTEGTSAPGSLMAHELSHVVQFGTSANGLPSTIAPGGDTAEYAADSAATGRASRIAVAEAGGVRLLRDTRLDRLIAGLRDVARNAPMVLSDQGYVNLIVEHFQGVDLRDPDNLGPVSDAVARHFPEQTLFAFLQRVERDASLAEVGADERRMQRQLGLLRVQRRGPYGTRTPFPVSEMVGDTAARAGGHLSSVSSAFFEGVIEGMGGPGSDRLVQQLSSRLRASVVINVVAPGVFAAGAAVGVGQDFWQGIRGLWELITNFPEMMAKLGQLFSTLASPAAPGIARVMGRHLGQAWRADLVRLAQHNIFRFTFELGRIVGPTIIYAVLTILGVTATVTVSAAAARLASLFRRFPRIIRILERIAEHLPRRRRSPISSATDAEIEAAVQSIDVPRSTGPPSAPRIGGRAVPTRQRPRLDIDTLPRRAGETARAAVARVRRIIGRRLSDISSVRAAWERARAHVLQSRTLTSSNYEELYNLTRSRFWREVRRDPQAVAYFTDAGFRLPAHNTTAPVLRGVDPSIPVTETRVSLDHDAEKAIGNNWQAALDADNLRMEFAMPNTYREIVQRRHPELR